MPSWPLTMHRPESFIHHRDRGVPEHGHERQACHLSGFAAPGLVAAVAGVHMGRV
jgi:hypothetical protein